MWLKAVMEKRVSEELEEAAMAENTRLDEEEERRRPKKLGLQEERECYFG